MYQRILAPALAAACGIMGFTSNLAAQPLWPDQTIDREITVEFLKPEFEGEDDTDFLTSAIFVSGRFPLNPTIEGEVEVPFSRYGISNDRVDRSESAIGNPYIGIRGRLPKVMYRVGVRLPFASSDDATALTSGRLADNDRFDAFLADELGLSGSVTGPTRLADKVFLDIGGGPLLLVSTEDDGGDDAEAYARYFLLGRYVGDQFLIKSGFTGQIWLTESDLDFGERSVHQFGLSGALNTGTVRPGLLVRIPLDEDLRDNIDYVVGVNLTVVVD